MTKPDPLAGDRPGNGPPSLRFKALWALIGIGLLGVIIALSLLAVPGPPGPPGIDKVSHLLAYGALMGWWGMVQPARRLVWAGVLLLLGLSLEFAQSLTGYRTLDRWDAVANTLGIVLALVLLHSPLGRILSWFDQQLADRIDSRLP